MEHITEEMTLQQVADLLMYDTDWDVDQETMIMDLMVLWPDYIYSYDETHIYAVPK